MRDSYLPGLLASTVVMLTVVGDVPADISVADAAQIVKEVTGTSVEGMTTSTRDFGKTRVVVFKGVTPGGRRGEYQVDVSRGVFMGWMIGGPDPGEAGAEPLTDARAIRIAQDQATRVLGAEAQDLRWRVESRSEGHVVVTGESVAAGTPLREGLGPKVRVGVWASGAVDHYWQLVPTEAERQPLPVSVSENRARAVALADADPGGKRGLAASRARLVQVGGTVRWELVVGAPEVVIRGGLPGPTTPAPVYYMIDAQSAKVLGAAHGRSGDLGAPQEADGPQTGAARLRAPWPAVTGAAVLCVAAAVVVGLARRRASAAR